MKFLDANVFIYVYYKPRRQLSQRKRHMKELAKQIIRDVSNGKEQVVMAVVHLSEMVKILKHGISPDKLKGIVRGLFMSDNIRIEGVTKEEYFAAADSETI